MVFLTQAEREKFSASLKQEAESNRGIIEQLIQTPHGKIVADVKKREVAACLILCNLLDSIEDQQIG